MLKENEEEESVSEMRDYETPDPHQIPVQQSYMLAPTQMSGYYEQPNYHPHFVQPQMVNCPPPMITAFCDQSYMIEQPQPQQIPAYGYPQYHPTMAPIQVDAYGNQSFVSNMMAPQMLAYNSNSLASFGEQTLPQYNMMPQQGQYVNQPMSSFYGQPETPSNQYENSANKFDLNDSVSSLSTIYPRSVVASSTSSSSEASLSPEEPKTRDWLGNRHKKRINDDKCKFLLYLF